ncbi:hypothetical protein, partial [Xanthomonas perforans]|uniref:hypothetical protein n=1 Tax=Xanthomonas perforans TaxID=442694 RepID=UPI00062D4D87
VVRRPGCGGVGRAPDLVSLESAGLVHGFSFIFTITDRSPTAGSTDFEQVTVMRDVSVFAETGTPRFGGC